MLFSKQNEEKKSHEKKKSEFYIIFSSIMSYMINNLTDEDLIKNNSVYNMNFLHSIKIQVL